MILPISLGAFFVGFLLGHVYGLWLSAEEAKAERQKFSRIAQANSESVPRAAGFNHRRIG